MNENVHEKEMIEDWKQIKEVRGHSGSLALELTTESKQTKRNCLK